MKPHFLIIIILVLLVAAGAVSQASAQLRDETVEERLNRFAREKIRHKKAATRVKGYRQKKAVKSTRPKTFSSINISSGYETNAQSSSIRKGDMFEEMLYSLSYTTSLPQQWRFTGSYNLDVLQYNEMTDLSNILNHTRLGLQRLLGFKYVMGFGYDGAWLYYPTNETGNYLFHKGYVFLRHNLSRKAYQQLTMENGVKDYTLAYALGDESGTLDDKKRQDKRQSVEYAYVRVLTDRVKLKLRGKYSVNDSNARYQDFYDYTAYDFIPRLSIKLTQRISVTASVGYIRRVYKSRIIAAGEHKERDNDYVTTIGLSYAFSDDNSIDTMYTYRQSYSNDSTAEYSGSSISMGWRHNF